MNNATLLHIENLLIGHLAGRATQAERAELFRLLGAHAEDADMHDLLEAFIESEMDELVYQEQEWADVIASILASKAKEPPVRRITPIIRWAAAIAAVFILAIGLYFLNQDTQQPQHLIASTHDIQPGHAGAIVTLSDGRKIALDTAKDGLIAMDGGVQLIKENGQIRYVGAAATTTALNTVSTDRGLSWPVMLPDGSTAWLNTSSSIRYPLNFTGKERRVKMTGECYFEVKHDDNQPFRVELPNGLVVEDVGTAFNIRSYADETKQTTTVTEGVVNIASASQPILQYKVEKGRQAIAGRGGVERVQPAENLDEITAWKENRFRFRKASVRTILTEAARWYDMELVFQDEITEPYTISMSRAVPLSKLLSDMETGGGVHFTVSGKTVTVTK